MSQPFDLDAAVGGQATKPFPFTWGGKAFELPRVLDLPVDRQLDIVSSIEGLDDGDPDVKELLALLRLAIGEELLAELSAAKPLSGRALMALLSAWIEFQGGELGKSRPSSPSSNGTGPRSKRTSPSAPAPRIN